MERVLGTRAGVTAAWLARNRGTTRPTTSLKPRADLWVCGETSTNPIPCKNPNHKMPHNCRTHFADSPLHRPLMARPVFAMLPLPTSHSPHAWWCHRGLLAPATKFLDPRPFTESHNLRGCSQLGTDTRRYVYPQRRLGTWRNA